MLLYFVFLLLIIVLLKHGQLKLIKGVNLYSVAYFFVFLFSALRFDVGYDFSLYYKWIKGDMKFIDDQLARLEILSRKLVVFSHDVNFIQLFFVLSSLLIVFLFYKTIKRHSLDFTVSTLIFLCFPIFFFYSLSVIRQYMAIAIVFYGYRYIKERNWIFYGLIVFLATLFHKSAFIVFPIYFLYGNAVGKKIILLVYVLSFFASNILAFFISLISERYSIYLGEISGEGGNLLLLFFQGLGLFLLFILFSTKDKIDKEFNFYLICYFIGLLIWASLSKYGHAGIRGGLYFMIYTILLVPYLIKKVKQYYLIRQSIFMICFIFFFFNLYVGSKHKIKDPNMPYQTFFFKTEKDLKPDE